MYIYLPDKATRSVESRPTLPNLRLSCVTSSKGLGSPSIAPCKFALLLSLLPSCTSQHGPPACTKNCQLRTLL